MTVRILCACQGTDLRRVAPGPRTGTACALVRERFAMLHDDRELHSDMARLTDLVRGGALLATLAD